MRALTYHEYGDPSVLQVEDVPEPHAGAGQVRIKVKAATVNPIDWKFRAGYLKDMVPLEFPVVPGRDASGVVDEVGDEVTGVVVGDEVFGLSSTGATTAEYAVLTSWASKPSTWSFEQAAGAGVSAETSIRVLNELGVHAGTTLLIEGAAGGVGSSAVQLAVGRGATVIGTAGAANQDFVRSLGAAATTYGPGLVVRVKDLVPDGVDVVFDTAGKGSMSELIGLVDEPADIVTIADYGAVSLGVRLSDGGSGSPMEALAEAARLGAEGRYTPVIAETYPLDRAGEAHARSEAGHARGKLVIVP